MHGGRMRLKMLLLVICMYAAPGAAPAAVDCSRAKSNVDKLVCSSSVLGVAEEEMARSYRSAMRRGVDLRELQRTHIEWYEQVRNACNDVPCLLKAFDDRSAELDNY
ncbi:MAG: hypothetical protein AMJ66_11535 [Betaproteobacteria bacterium SG8_40]|nr:MAG: hypothetical protein AMJ66_11535 [Betaproteobacteria bacterium SG8_40]